MYPRTDRRCASLCTATNKKLVTFLFCTATKCSDFQKKLIDTITTSNFYLKLKENNENDMAAQVFWAVFFIPADGRAKSAQQLISTVLPFHPLYFPWIGVSTILFCQQGLEIIHEFWIIFWCNQPQCQATQLDQISRGGQALQNVSSVCRAVGRFENPGGKQQFGGYNLYPWFRQD